MSQPPIQDLIDERLPDGLGGRLYGVFPAQVTDIRDPDGLGRVKVTLPFSPDPSDAQYAAWARIAQALAGSQRGTWLIPDVGDEVLITFEHGDPRRPYVLGGLWNGRDNPPERMDSGGQNNKKVIVSRKGVKVTLDDTDGQVSLKLETPGGQIVTLEDGAASIELTDSNGNSVRLESSGITIQSSSSLQISASTVSINAGSVSVSAGTSTFSGVVNANTVIAPAVVGSSYTPAPGNML